MKQNNFFAVDLGATSGRTILGSLDEGKLELRELTRFPNHLIQTGGHFFWDIYALYNEIINGLKVVAKEGIHIESIGIDTWGVDFVCIGKDGQLLANPFSYRDPHTEGAMDDYFNIIPREKVYEITGIQFMNFNSLFQLHAMRRHNSSALAAADKILFTPDALSYMLTGQMVTEYTIASTSQMLDPRTKRFDPQLLNVVGVSEQQFGRFVFPGEKVGELTPEIQKMTGLGAIPVIAVAGHDTGSAVAAVPADNEKFAYLSSGTWSLMGIEVKDAIIDKNSFENNFTNEGGVEGTTRFLKNICGMWLLERCRAEWKAQGHDYGYGELIEAALAVPAFPSLINPDAPCFANPPQMIEAIRGYCNQTKQYTPQTYGELTRCIFESLALRYRQVFGFLKEMAPMPIEKLHVIGGGSKNNLLNQFTANAVGVPVLAGPSECTAIGNIMLQAKANGLVNDIAEMRRVIAAGINLPVFNPENPSEWETGYKKYLSVYREDI
ncbi:MAG: rhamnulokinase [Bacteroidales bacterium]|nr:rhamnulokinase [Bacteroidales bacterium]